MQATHLCKVACGPAHPRPGAAGYAPRHRSPLPRAASPEHAFPARPYSTYAARAFSTRVYWGDTHVHTAYSMDVGRLRGRGLGRPRPTALCVGRRWSRPLASA